MPKHFTSHKTAILTYLLPSPRASARSPNSSEHSKRSTGEADLQGAARSTLSSEHSERSIGAAELNISLSIAYGVPDNACVMGCLTNTIRVFLERLVWLVLLLSATSPVFCGIPETLVAFWGALCGSARKILPASCLFIISNTIEFSSLHRLYPIARRASYRRSRPLTSNLLTCSAFGASSN